MTRRYNQNGLLVEERDGDRFLDNLHRLASDPALWQILSQNAAASVRENFEHRTQIANLESIYDELALYGGKTDG